MSSNYRFSIGIISYNRPDELRRTLKSIYPLPENVEVVICDDKSPKSKEILVSIKSILNKNPQIKFISNEINLGYDRNLFKVIEAASSDIVLLLGDDDYLEPGALDNVSNFLNKVNDLHCGFLRFRDNNSNQYTRQFKTTIFFDKHKMNREGSFIYNSILFSGLIFRKSSVLRYKPIFSKYFQSIYLQVALFGVLNSQYGSYYISGPGIIVGGDGENGFGFNEASSGIDADLKDRSSILSNLSYHKRLFEVLRNLERDIGIKVFAKFLKEYKIRSVKALFEARRKNRQIGSTYLNELRKLKLPGMWIYEPIYFLILNLPFSILNLPFMFIQRIILYYRNEITIQYNKK